MRNKIFILFIFFLAYSTLFSQIYQPLDSADFKQRQEFLSQLKSKKENLIKKIKTKYENNINVEIQKYFNDYYTDFEKEINEKNYSFNSGLDLFLNRILTQIKTNNPQIPDNLHILVSKDNTPNAFCLTDGTFVINMGLFNWLDNEEQIASVLSHEIAHNLLDHSMKMIVKQVNENNADKLTYKNLNKMSANKKSTAYEIIKNKFYKKSEIKRQHEIEADSLGYLLYSKSGYAKPEYINTLKNLMEFDSISPRKLEIETYKQLYDLAEQPFNESWMKQEDFSAYNYDFYKEKFDQDSISSHPETQIRIETLKKYFSELTSEEPKIKPNDDFNSMRKISRFEIIPNLYHSEDYGVGVYICMQFLQDKEEEAYYKNWLGKLFDKIYEGRKNYNLNRYLDTVDPKNQSESYRQFLSFMWNLKMNEAKIIAEHYKKGTQ